MNDREFSTFAWQITTHLASVGASAADVLDVLGSDLSPQAVEQRYPAPSTRPQATPVTSTTTSSIGTTLATPQSFDELARECWARPRQHSDHGGAADARSPASLLPPPPRTAAARAIDGLARARWEAQRSAPPLLNGMRLINQAHEGNAREFGAPSSATEGMLPRGW